MKKAKGPSLQAVLKAHKPGDKITVSYRRRNGAGGTTTITLAENPAMELIGIERTGGTLTAEQKRFRDAWLGSRIQHR